MTPAYLSTLAHVLIARRSIMRALEAIAGQRSASDLARCKECSFGLICDERNGQSGTYPFLVPSISSDFFLSSLRVSGFDFVFRIFDLIRVHSRLIFFDVNPAPPR